MQEIAQVNARLPVEVARRLQAEADAREWSASKLAAKLITEGLARLEAKKGRKA